MRLDFLHFVERTEKSETNWIAILPAFCTGFPTITLFLGMFIGHWLSKVSNAAARKRQAGGKLPMAKAQPDPPGDIKGKCKQCGVLYSQSWAGTTCSICDGDIVLNPGQVLFQFPIESGGPPSRADEWEKGNNSIDEDN